MKDTEQIVSLPPQEGFANLLRRSRIHLKKSMGEVARELGITVVYYSEVEAGKKAAFPEKKVNYKTLAETLGLTEPRLRLEAAFDREKRSILKTFSCSPEGAQVAVSFGRRLSSNNLTEKQLAKIQKILNEGE